MRNSFTVTIFNWSLWACANTVCQIALYEADNLSFNLHSDCNICNILDGLFAFQLVQDAEMLHSMKKSVMARHVATNIILPWHQDIWLQLGNWFHSLQQDCPQVLLAQALPLDNCVQDLSVRLVFKQDEESLDSWTHVLVSDGAA